MDLAGGEAWKVRERERERRHRARESERHRESEERERVIERGGERERERELTLARPPTEKPGAGVWRRAALETLAMAVNLDKDAYYRRIKRLYGNWKVLAGGRVDPVPGYWFQTSPGDRGSLVRDRGGELGREVAASLASPPAPRRDVSSLPSATYNIL